MKQVRHIITTISILLSVWLIWTAGADPVKKILLSDAARKEIEIRKISYAKKKKDECRIKAIEMAAQMVDSALLEQALFIGADTLVRPERPNRPFAETFTSNIENIPVKPFLKRHDFVSPFQKKDTFALDSLKLRDSINLNRKGLR